MNHSIWSKRDLIDANIGILFSVIMFVFVYPVTYSYFPKQEQSVLTAFYFSLAANIILMICCLTVITTDLTT